MPPDRPADFPARWRNVAVLSGTIVFTLTGIFGWHRVLPLYLRELRAEDSQIGLAYLALAFAHRLPQLVGGWLADRIGRKRIVVGLTMFMGACYVGIGLAPTWQGVVSLVVVCWIAGALQWPALLSLVADSVPEHRRGRAIAILETASMAGITLGPLVGAGVLRRLPLSAGGWTWLLLICAAFYLGSAVVRGLLLRETAPVGTRGTLLARFGSIDWRILGLPAGAYVIAMLLYNFAVDGPFQSFYLNDVHRLDEAGISSLNFYVGVVACASALSGGWLTDRFGCGRVIQASFALSILLLLPFALPSEVGLGAHPWMAVAALVAIAFPQEAFVISYQKLVTTVAPEGSRALYIGASSLVTGLVVPWSFPFGEWLYSGDPTRRAPFVAALVCGALGLALSLRLGADVRRRPLEPVPAPAPGGGAG